MFVAGTVYTTPFGEAVCLSANDKVGVFAHPLGGCVHASHETSGFAVKKEPKAIESKPKSKVDP